MTEKKTPLVHRAYHEQVVAKLKADLDECTRERDAALGEIRKLNDPEIPTGLVDAVTWLIDHSNAAWQRTSEHHAALSAALKREEGLRAEVEA